MNNAQDNNIGYKICILWVKFYSMHHQLFDDKTGKTTTLTCEERTLTSVSNGRTTTKTFEEDQEAEKQFLKKEWELLKKGAVMRAPDAALGHPLMHAFMGKWYTGCLSFEATPHGVYVYRSGEDMKDELLRVAEDGVIMEVLALPKPLAWEIRYDTQRNQLLLDLDHYIYEYDFASADFKLLTGPLEKPGSFAAVAGGVRVYATHPKYYISQAPYSERVEYALELEFVNGSLPLCAALSPDGQWLALHNDVGLIKLINTADHSNVKVLTGDFKTAEQLLWTKDSSQLIVHEAGFGKQLRIFDIAGEEENSYEGLLLPTYSQDVTNCCLSADNALLVCTQRTHAYVFDFVQKNFLYSFPLQHVVKRAQIRFIADRKLGVRSDYGCFSIYQL